MNSCFALALAGVRNELQARDDVIALLFHGSAQRGEATRNSDLDLYAVTTGDETWIEGRWLNGVEVELHFAPLRAWRERIEACQPVAINAFSTGELLFDNDGEAAGLKRLAERLRQQGPTPLAVNEINRLRYHLTGMAHDISDLPAASTDARLIAGLLVPKALEAWCAFRQI